MDFFGRTRGHAGAGSSGRECGERTAGELLSRGTGTADRGSAVRAASAIGSAGQLGHRSDSGDGSPRSRGCRWDIGRGDRRDPFERADRTGDLVRRRGGQSGLGCRLRIGRFGGEAVASESVKERIRKIIRSEDGARPFSDQRIAEMLKSADIDIARRTVTKYRESMNVLSSTKRRRIV